MNIHRATLMSTISVVAIGCNHAPMEIVRLNVVDSSFQSTPIPTTLVREPYVVANPIEDIDSLAQCLVNFSLRESRQFPTSAFSWERPFYRETSNTPRTFREKDEDMGKLDSHGEDFLLSVSHDRTDTRDCWFVMIPGRTSSRFDTCSDLPAKATLRNDRSRR